MDISLFEHIYSNFCHSSASRDGNNENAQLRYLIYVLTKNYVHPPLFALILGNFTESVNKHAGFQFLLIDSHPRVTYMFLL